MRLKQILNLKKWHRRELSVGYGTRDKTVLKQTAKGKLYYLAKTYDKDLGELRSEVCASAIGRLFGFSVQRTWFCNIPQYRKLGLRHSRGVLIQLDVRRQKDTRRGQFREDLVHGAALISLVDRKFASLKDEKARRKIYTLDVVVRAIRNYVRKNPGSTKLWDQFFELLIFDALIGSTDRHYNNWGLLEKADDSSFLRLAPAFDNGISLMWKLEDYRAQFMRDLFTRRFIRRAESMFKRVGGGKFTLFEVLEELHRIGDYAGSKIVDEMLERVAGVSEAQIRAHLFRDVPQRVGFETGRRELDTIALYISARRAILIETLARLRQA